jgi:pimeloyl-ACP methyl ester carboxylesterase
MTPGLEPGLGQQELSVQAADGRQLQVLVAGPADGLPLVFHTGTPSGLVGYEPMLAEAADRGLRSVLYSRPGYGKSTPQPGRSVADAAGDVAAILDEIGAGQFLTAGWSGGGPHALACAVLLPERCRAGAIIAGVAPHDAADLDWQAGMGAENVQEFGAALAGEAELTGMLEVFAAQLRTITGPEVAAGLGDLVSDVDKAAATGAFGEYLAAAFRGSVASGIAGWRDDDLAFTRSWGFPVTEPGDAMPRVAIWQGDQDRMVPFAHGEWLAAHVPRASAHLIKGEGHLSLPASRYGAILDDLMELDV